MNANQELIETSHIYSEIRNNSSELIANLKHIKDEIYLFKKNASDYSVQIDSCIESYESLTILLEEEEEFFDYISKKKEMENIISTIHSLILSISNYSNNIDTNHNITRQEIYDWSVMISDCFNNIIHEFKETDEYSEYIIKIENLLSNNSFLLGNESNLELFDFEYIYKTKDYVLYIEKSLNILNELKNESLNMNLLLEIFDIISKVPSSNIINKLFNVKK